MKKKFRKYEEGFVLPSILMIGFLIISLLLSLFVALYFRQLIEIKKINKKKLDLACFSAIERHLVSAGMKLKSGREVIKVDSFDVVIQYGLKGLYYEVTAEARKQKDSSALRIVFGKEITKSFENAVSLSSQDLNAWVAGETRITGNLAFNTEQISRGSIFGIRNSGDNFLIGRLIPHANIKSKLYRDSLIAGLFEPPTWANAVILKGVAELQVSELDQMRRIVIKGDLKLKGSYSSRQKKSVSVYATGIVNIQDGCSSDIDAEIECDSSVIIGKNAHLENLIVISQGKITVEQGARLKNVQLFSMKGIDITGSVLYFPSSLCLYVENSVPESRQGVIELKSSILNGSALLISDVTGIGGNKSRIRIDRYSRVHGLIYSENLSEITGEVLGSVYSYGFYFNKPPAEYINWLVDLRIDRKGLDRSFLIPVGFDEYGKYRILSENWLY